MKEQYLLYMLYSLKLQTAQQEALKSLDFWMWAFSNFQHKTYLIPMGKKSPHHWKGNLHIQS